MQLNMLSAALETIVPIRADLSGLFVVLLSSLLLAITCRPRYAPGLPLINGRKRWELFSYKARMRFVTNGPEILRDGFATVRFVHSLGKPLLDIADKGMVFRRSRPRLSMQ